MSIGRWTDRGIPAGEVSTGGHLSTCAQLLREVYLPRTLLEELFLVDTDAMLDEFAAVIEAKGENLKDDDGVEKEEVALVVIQDPEYRRYKSTVDMDLAVKIYNVSHGGAGRFWKL